MTSQERQLKKVKLYRVLKVVFYAMGLPLFVMAVFLASIRFIGHEPFTGNGDIAAKLGFFNDINVLFTSPALYGVWIALAIWVVIAIVHIVLSKTVKNRRVRTLSVVSFTLVVMMSCLLGLDVGLSKRIEKVANEYPDAVVADYQGQLAYYRTISSNAHGKSATENIIKKVDLLKNVYNVGLTGAPYTGVAGAISSKPVTYFNIISDDGVSGIDIGFKTENGFAKLDVSGSKGDYTIARGDGNITKEVEGNQVVRLEPNSDGILVINGKTYSHYWAMPRYAVNGTTVYTWYCRDMKSVGWTEKNGDVTMSGIYGEALYDASGMLSDGWVFGLDNVIEVLEDYYEAKDAIDNGNKTYYAEAYARMYEDAWVRRDNYYNNEADPWLKALYNQEIYMTERFSLTRGELDELLAKVGALLGDNKLFDYLFTSIDETLDEMGVSLKDVSFLGGSLGNFFKKLNKGIGLSTFGINESTMGTITEILGLLTGKTYDYVDDIILTLSYKAPDCYNVQHDNLYLALVRGVNKWMYVNADGSAPTEEVAVTRKSDGKWYNADDTEFVPVVNGDKKYDKDGDGAREITLVLCPGSDSANDIMLDIDFNDEIKDSSPENIFDEINGTNTYAFDFDTLSAFLNNGLNRVLERYNVNLNEGTVGTIVGLVKTLGLLKSIDVDGEAYTGLVISGIEIPILNSEGKVALDINGILSNLLQNWYGYKSAVIKPVWEFYVNPKLPENNAYRIAQENYAKYERALFTGKTYGSMIGSTLIGDTLGTGSYPSSFGLTDLASVQQLKVDLSYQPECYPLMVLRDMIIFFAGLVILFYFMSFVAAQREDDYATGKMVARSRKEDKATKKHEASVIAEFDANAENGAEAQVPEPDGDKQTPEGDGADNVDPPADEAQSNGDSPETGDGDGKTGEDPDIPVKPNSDEEVL